MVERAMIGFTVLPVGKIGKGGMAVAKGLSKSTKRVKSVRKAQTGVKMAQKEMPDPYAGVKQASEYLRRATLNNKCNRFKILFNLD
jgi:hypothetical protein